MDEGISRELRRYNYLVGETEAIYHELSLRMGLSDSAMQILYTICDCGGDRCPLQTICRYTSLSKQTVNSALRRLEAQGVLYLQQAGGKAKTVCLTEAGKQLAQRTALRLIAMENQVLGAWPREDVQQYLALTERFLTALREKAKSIEGL